METTDCATEGDPLKREGDGVELGTASHAAEPQKKSCKEVLGFSKRTHWRTAAFFLSLFLCLTVAFAFSFIIPCPVRPQYLTSWNRTFSGAETYDFLAFEDASKDKVMDVLFVLKDTEGSLNNTCDKAGLPSPCVFVLAVDGTDGETLWERMLSPEFHWAQCGLDEQNNRVWDCLLFHADQLSALDKHKGEVKWQQPHPPGLHSTLPVLNVPDLDEDKVSDIALVASNNVQNYLVFLSGKTGDQIGSPVALNSSEATNYRLHRTADGCHYLLLVKDTGVYGLALWRITAEAGVKVSLKKDKHWEQNASVTSGLVPVYKSDSVTQVVKTKGSDGTSDLLFVTDTEVALVEGKQLRPQWSFNISSVFREPSFGHFNKDGVLDVVIEEEIGNHTKRVVILDGKSGHLLWEVGLSANPNSPRPASIHTTNSYSIFMIWGLWTEQTASFVPSTGDHFNMLHPLYSNVLLEASNITDQIITFRATLLERGRHAAYILLTGPGSEGADGAVVLSKRKLKQDVPDGSIHRIDGSQGSESDDDIKEAFNRLRFSDE